MRFTRLLTVPALVASLAFAAACGTDQEAERAKAKAAQDRRDRAELRTLVAKHEKKVEQAQEVAETCDDQMGQLVDELGELNSRLGIGLSYDEYTDTVGGLRVTYDRIDWDANDEVDPADALKCIQDVGLPAEKALNLHAKATRTWGDCLDDFDCVMDDVDPTLQKRWASATTNIEKAKSGLDDIKDSVEDLEDDAPTLRDVVGERKPTETESA